jgi:preprotein translocase subunit SecD
MPNCASRMAGICLTIGGATGMSQRTFMYSLVLILLIMLASIYIVIPNTPGIHFAGINKDFETRLGLDLVGGVQALYEVDLPENVAIDADSMRTVVTIFENRASGILGVGEATVQQAGTRRLVVELPGETDTEKALSALQQTGQLEFVDLSMLDQNQIILLQSAEISIKTDYGLSDQTTSPVTSTETLTDPLEILQSMVFPTVMTGDKIKSVLVETSPAGQPGVSFELTTEGARIFGDHTSRHVGDILAIVLDKRIISAPVINDAITDGRGIIQGNFTSESANILAVQLRYGSLPIPLKVVEVRTVGPTLGQDSLNKSLIAGLIGFSIVILFMGLYYRLPGVVANLSILLYALIAFAIFRFIPVTLTLPGIAGFMLSTGSALDANILIFERLKEELRAGKPLRQAADLGFRRAWSSIRDANIATIITSAILFWFGSTFGATIVKGFAVTLLIGVAISLFTSLVATRVFLKAVLDYFFKSKDYEKWFGI